MNSHAPAGTRAGAPPRVRFARQATHVGLAIFLSIALLAAGLLLAGRALSLLPPISFASLLEGFSLPAALLFLLLHIPIHELAHVGMCRLVGGRIVAYGFKPGLFNLPKPYITTGFPRSWDRLAEAHGLTAAAGPLLDLSLVVLTLTAATLPLLAPWQAGLVQYALLATVALMFNLNPFKRTDGRNLTGALRLIAQRAGRQRLALTLPALHAIAHIAGSLVLFVCLLH